MENMTVTPVAVKEDIRQRLDYLSENEALRVLKFINTLKGHEPNEETIAAFKEAEDLDSLTTCTNLKDMLIKCGINR